MPHSLLVLSITAASIGFIHTILGPDHYVPFIMISRAGSWTRSKTLAVTLLCGLGHVLSSVVIGAIGIVFGVAIHKIAFIESVRGDIATWALIAFGMLYLAWGLRQAYLHKPHTHFHTHNDGDIHSHEHTHHNQHVHAHEDTSRSTMTTWTLFTIFILGPCEPLIPILMYPAAHQNTFGIIWIASIFGIVTITTMIATVYVLSTGIAKLPLRTLDRYIHALAGGVIALTGITIQIFQL